MSGGKKVFVIGFHKTGTTSLKGALALLGYSVSPVREVKHLDASPKSWDVLKPMIDKYDAFRAQPWPLFFREIYEYRPDSKFILTIRPTEEWLKSVTNYFGEKTTPKREAIYGAGSPLGHEHAYAARYDQHNREVLEFFSDKPRSLLIMDLATGIGWRELCAFLDEAGIPTRPFPHRNPTHRDSVSRQRQSGES